MEIIKNSIALAFIGKLGNLTFNISSSGKNYCYLNKRKKSKINRIRIKKLRILNKIIARKWKKLKSIEKQQWKDYSLKYSCCNGYNLYVASFYKMIKDKGIYYTRKSNILYDKNLKLNNSKKNTKHKFLNKRKKYLYDLESIKKTYFHLNHFPIKLTNRLIVPKITNYNDMKKAFLFKLIQRKVKNKSKLYKKFSLKNYNKIIKNNSLK